MKTLLVIFTFIIAMLVMCALLLSIMLVGYMDRLKDEAQNKYMRNKEGEDL